MKIIIIIIKSLYDSQWPRHRIWVPCPDVWSDYFHLQPPDFTVSYLFGPLPARVWAWPTSLLGMLSTQGDLTVLNHQSANDTASGNRARPVSSLGMLSTQRDPTVLDHQWCITQLSLDFQGLTECSLPLTPEPSFYGPLAQMGSSVAVPQQSHGCSLMVTAAGGN